VASDLTAKRARCCARRNANRLKLATPEPVSENWKDVLGAVNVSGESQHRTATAIIGAGTAQPLRSAPIPHRAVGGRPRGNPVATARMVESHSPRLTEEER